MEQNYRSYPLSDNLHPGCISRVGELSGLKAHEPCYKAQVIFNPVVDLTDKQFLVAEWRN